MIRNFVRRCVSFSSPGKVLLVGGYAILHPEYSGLVISTTPRISSSVSSKYTFSSKSTIDVISERYGVEEVYDLDISSGGNNSRLIDVCLSYSFDLMDVSDNFDGKIEISTDPEFFDGYNKTGLGSSAATTVSLVSSLLVNFGYFSGEEEDFEDQLFRICFLVHNIFQEKIGSGFDISAAIFGNQVYNTPSITSAIEETQLLEMSPSLLESIIHDDSLWDHKRRDIVVHPDIRLVMAQTGSGSKTPSLIGKVNSWSLENPNEYDQVIKSLNTSNLEFISIFESVECSNDFFDLQDSYMEILGNFKSLGEVTGARIVPEKQERIIQETVQSCYPYVPVVTLPGAGGDDALVGLTFGEDSFHILKEVWENMEGVNKVLEVGIGCEGLNRRY